MAHCKHLGYCCDQTEPSHGNPACSNSLYLPLSCTNFCASPELFTNDTSYQKEYIAKYFQNIDDYEVINVVGEDGIIFPYATVTVKQESNVELFNDVTTQPNFIPTDVGFIPMFDNNCSQKVLDLTNVNSNKNESHLKK